MIKRLQVDEQWSIGYDDQNNDQPVAVYRYGSLHRDLLKNPNRSFMQHGLVASMFCALIEVKDRENG